MKNIEDPAVSVIIPTLNAEKDLLKLLISLEEQSYPVDEIVIVDSASKDGTVCCLPLYHNILSQQNKARSFIILPVFTVIRF